MSLRIRSSAPYLVVSLAALLLSGCSMNSLSAPGSASQSTAYQGAAIKGAVEGGYQPLSGAHIYLMAASNAGYGAASTSLLTQGDGTDAIGTYVLTIPGGGFNISNAYSCQPGQQVYLLATGGNPGLTPATYSNSAATLMTAFGTCPSSGSFAGVIPFVVVNEVSTVAAAYALAGFTIDPTHVGSAASTLSKSSLINAFSNIPNMVYLNFGQAYATTPAVPGYSAVAGLSANGVVPRAKINTLADVAAGCVNSTGPASAPCTSFFNNTADSSGTKPTNVAQALINLAHNPANSFNFLALSTGTSPFQPTLAAAPNDWSLSIQYTVPKATHLGRPAIDAAGNVWIPEIGNNLLLELSPQGVVYSGPDGFAGSGINQPDAAAIDASGNVWVSNYTNSGIVSEFNSNGSPASVSGFLTPDGAHYDVLVAAANIWFGGQNSTTGITSVLNNFFTATSTSRSVGLITDRNDNIWVTNNNSNTLNVLYAVTNGVSSRQFAPNGLNQPAGIASDAANNLWIANAGANTVTRVATGVNFFGAPNAASSATYLGAGILKPYTTAVDGAGSVWIGNSNGSLSGISSGITALSPATGFTTASTAGYSTSASSYLNFFPPKALFGVAIAGTGDIWTTAIDGSIYQFIGLGAPTVTPKSYSTSGSKP